MTGKDMAKAGVIGAGAGLLALAGYHGIKKLTGSGSNSTSNASQTTGR